MRALALKLLADTFPGLADHPNIQKSIIAITFAFETTSFLLSNALSSDIKDTVREKIFGCYLKSIKMPSDDRCECFKTLSRHLFITKIDRNYRAVFYEQFLAEHIDSVMDAVVE